MQLLRKIAFPFSLVYALIVLIRNFLYDIKVFPSSTFDTRTICVGNLSVGGTGKTPMIELLIDLLSPKYKIAVLSRGYRRKSKGFVLANPNSTAEEIGDEPLQLARKFQDVNVAVDADRRSGIRKLERQIGPDVILLDDAFQHRKVQPDSSILLTAYDELYTRDWYLPTGNLRDSKNQAKRADLIIVTKCPENLSEQQLKKIAEEIDPQPEQQLLFCSLAYADSLKGYQEGVRLEELNGTKFSLVTGIARPEPLVTFLRSKGLDFEHLGYPDHHFFTAAEIQNLADKSHIITTEKDYMRLEGQLDNASYLSVRHRFLKDGEQSLLKRLTAL
ncbi:tetraacyldisaccharide 4'-kinase [Poritiphilus flavus]|uniref:Tetraacyldisaccharide 4'-kinase n=1 Tax=Poritiphilus flavus TaxID=2697053 RepID=A0A6L9EAS0_9FLAO|nr:tetraacyldisaccharide 4'-kinase [Poritiphilus flavus]NAS11743.1 tetraacyldisaccharide 4'-kinase [Poritiphilus flavus]